MFINPESLAPDIIDNLLKDFACQQIDSCEQNGIQKSEMEKLKRRVLNKELLIHFSSNEDLEEHSRIQIQPCEYFNLTKTQVKFAE